MIEGAAERERHETRLVAWQVSTTINLWSAERVSVAELMGDDVGDDMLNDEDALLAEAERMQRIADTKAIDAEAGWDNVLPPMPEDL